MKKTLTYIILIILTFLLASCSKKIDDEKTIYIIATQIPHEEILKKAEPLLNEKGYKLKITVTDDYGIPNGVVSNRSVDANFFQHIPFLDKYNSKVKIDKKLVNVASVHIEPLIGYSKNIKKVSEINKQSNILISNSEPDHGRVLSILAKEGVLKLKEGIQTLNATLKDIDEKNSIITSSNFKQVTPELLVRTYQSENNIDLAFINGNFVLKAKLPESENIIIESPQNNPYVNIIAVLEGREDLPKIKALAEVLTSKEIKEFIKNKYQGSVIPS